MIPTEILAPFSGAIVGLVLGLVGGGGSILAVPLLIYVVGIGSTHMALGTSAMAVALTAIANLVPHWRAGKIKWPCAAVFSVTGIIGAFAGSSIAKIVEGDSLLLLFGLLMLIVGLAMLFGQNGEGDPEIRLTSKTASALLPRLIPAGFGVGALSGFFGIGGGFLIVPGLIFATGMPLSFAIGTSLVAVAAFGATTAANYAISGLVDWPIAGMFIAGGAVGGVAGAMIGKLLGKNRHALRYVFAGVVMVVGLWIVWQGLAAAGML
ncbi:sulfite exporter TauE/SafE family protein [Mariluticola halotolerans]|uniref:sulfite exporter TauE/SafE family protein n=1 Tax=Mariluticola halotolerans TaxID=2909283 RepID=UPI0026E3FA12|nr:sulfite exporter TauE/SafE family protein [Mariluticola halotolerans]UJQ93281.1 sulfite exporter TauE/SafE family protein [Mariluticola halotolerans]